jgi:hypothetical protein
MISKDFALAGRAIFTIKNANGDRYTFRIAKKRGSDDVFFAGVLTGQNNESDYRYVGMVNPRTMRLQATGKGLPSTAQAFRTLDWILMILAGKRELPAGYVLMHAGKCGRCGRTLTVPESIESGIGPECASKMGL